VKTKENIMNKKIDKTCTQEAGLDNHNGGEVEEEPPGRRAICGEAEEELPGKTITGRQRYFGQTADADWNDWKWQFRHRITTIESLSEFIPLSEKQRKDLELVTGCYPLSITPYYLSLIDLHDPEDPLWKQAIPSILELTMGQVGEEDPLSEERDSVVPGLVHRYPDRVLMVLTDICPMLCRHCTRKREWHNGGWVRSGEEIRAMLDYIRRHVAVRDVIISGGDPLSLSTQYLEFVLAELRQIEHVEIIRIGTRFPVVLPQRIDDELCRMLSKYSPIWLNTHFNNHREVTPESATACDRLLRSGIPVNNQSVLLRGVNDSGWKQTKLCHALLRIKVRPYYLFQCDEVQGTEHLRVPVEKGIEIIRGMRGYTSGLAVPTFVIDLPGGGGKVPVQPDYTLTQAGDELFITNYQGHLFRCHNPKDGLIDDPAFTADFAAGTLTANTGEVRNADRVGV